MAEEYVCACGEEELGEMLKLINGIMRKEGEPGVSEDYPLVYRSKNLKNISICKSGGRVVSVVPCLPRVMFKDDVFINLGLIAPTGTHPDYRKRGFGLQCMQRNVRNMLRCGTDVSVLWTLVRTFPFYEKAGFQAVDFCDLFYECSPPEASVFGNYGGDVIEFNPGSSEHIEAVHKMHSCEPFGILRTHGEYPFILKRPGTGTYLLEEGSGFSAYITLSRRSNRQRIAEGGGGAKALETLLNIMISGLSEKVLINDYPERTALGDVLKKKLPGRRQKAEAPHIMARINNLPAFFKKISPCLLQNRQKNAEAFSIELTGSGETLSFEFGAGELHIGNRELSNHFVMTPGELTSIVFSQHKERPVNAPEAMKNIFPVRFPIWQLDRT